MPSTQEWQLQKLNAATSELLDELGSVATAAFQGDELSKVLIGGDWSNLYPLLRATIGAERIVGEHWIATIDQKVVGYAGWFPPGRLLMDSPDQAEAGFNEFVKSMPAELARWWKEYFLPKGDEVPTIAYGKDKKKSIWNLQTLCVLPELQGRGIGHSLLEVKEKDILANSTVSEMSVESATLKTTELYKYWGFEEKGKFHFESDVGEFDQWCLYKKL
ncbi:unnamed protein product [Somion occarium]|uniref:N-acetyltransferase domain-containing protein n=1 Tax=Somion occarium TaxID=3059160 RepID=A0ABP1CKL2_9APHY